MDASQRDKQILESIDAALVACWKQYEAVQALAMHYPEASHLMTNPRKPDAIVILERLRQWLAES